MVHPLQANEEYLGSIRPRGRSKVPTQRLVFRFYGPSLQGVRSFIAVPSTSDPLVECVFIVVLSRKTRENDLRGIRTLNF